MVIYNSDSDVIYDEIENITQKMKTHHPLMMMMIRYYMC